MRILTALSLAPLIAMSSAVAQAAQPNTVLSDTPAGYSVVSELAPSGNGSFLTKIELRALSPDLFLGKVYIALFPDKPISIPLQWHPGLEVRLLAHDLGAGSVRFTVEVFRLGLLEARQETSFSFSPPRGSGGP